MTPTPDSEVPRTPRCPPSPASVPGEREPDMPGPATRTWPQLQGAGRPRAGTPELPGTRSGIGNRAPTPRTRFGPEHSAYRAASKLPAREKGATGFPGRTSRALVIARVPRTRENGVRKKAAAPLSGQMWLPLRERGRVWREGGGLFPPRPSFSCSLSEELSS